MNTAGRFFLRKFPTIHIPTPFRAFIVHIMSSESTFTSDLQSKAGNSKPRSTVQHNSQEDDHTGGGSVKWKGTVLFAATTAGVGAALTAYFASQGGFAEPSCQSGLNDVYYDPPITAGPYTGHTWKQPISCINDPTNPGGHVSEDASIKPGIVTIRGILDGDEDVNGKHHTLSTVLSQGKMLTFDWCVPTSSDTKECKRFRVSLSNKPRRGSRLIGLPQCELRHVTSKPTGMSHIALHRGLTENSPEKMPLVHMVEPSPQEAESADTIVRLAGGPDEIAPHIIPFGTAKVNCTGIPSEGLQEWNLNIFEPTSLKAL